MAPTMAPRKYYTLQLLRIKLLPLKRPLQLSLVQRGRFRAHLLDRKAWGVLGSKKRETLSLLSLPTKDFSGVVSHQWNSSCFLLWCEQLQLAFPPQLNHTEDCFIVSYDYAIEYY